MEDIRTFIEILAGAAVSAGGFFVGRKKTNAEANRTAYEAFNVAFASLRDEIKNNAERFNEVRKALEEKIEEQGKRIAELEKENQELREAIKRMTK